MQKLAVGDLTFHVRPRDERDVVRRSLQKVGEDLNAILAQIHVSGAQMASGSAQVSESSQSLSQGATEHRITSYNVCYTKLLRDGARSAISAMAE